MENIFMPNANFRSEIAGETKPAGMVKRPENQEKDFGKILNSVDQGQKQKKIRDSADKADKTIKLDKTNKSDETIKPDESNKPDKTIKSDESNKPDKTIKPDESNKPDKTIKPDASKEETGVTRKQVQTSGKNVHAIPQTLPFVTDQTIVSQPSTEATKANENTVSNTQGLNPKNQESTKPETDEAKMVGTVAPQTTGPDWNQAAAQLATGASLQTPALNTAVDLPQNSGADEAIIRTTSGMSMPAKLIPAPTSTLIPTQAQMQLPLSSVNMFKISGNGNLAMEGKTVPASEPGAENLAADPTTLIQHSALMPEKAPGLTMAALSSLRNMQPLNLTSATPLPTLENKFMNKNNAVRVSSVNQSVDPVTYDNKMVNAVANEAGQADTVAEKQIVPQEANVISKVKPVGPETFIESTNSGRDTVAKEGYAVTGEKVGASSDGSLNLALIQTKHAIKNPAESQKVDYYPGVAPVSKETAGPMIAVTETKSNPSLERSELFSQIVDQAKLMVNNGHTSMEMSLKPEHLGKLKLEISLDHQIVTARFVAESDQVKQIIETGLNDLKRMMHENGIQVDQLMVSVGQQQNDSGMFQQSGSRREQGGYRKTAFVDGMPDHFEEGPTHETHDSKYQSEIDLIA